MKKDQDKTKEQLITELDKLRQRVTVVEASAVKRNQAKTILAVPEEDLQRLFELLPIGITILDMKGIILYSNSAVYNEGGYAEGEFTGKHFSKISSVRVKDIPKFIRVFDSVVRGKIPKPFEVIYQHKDGTAGWTEISIGFIKIGGKQRILVIQHDITERRQVENILQEDKERYRAVFKQTGESILVVDADTGTLVDFNDEAHESLGYTRREFEKLKIADFEDIESPEQVEQHIEKIIKEGSDVFETKHRTKQGEIREIQVSSRTFHVGERNCVLSICHDISERKQAEERERQLQQEVNLASRLATVGEMASGIAHEINNPLTGVIGFSSLLLKKDIPDHIRKDVDVIYEGAQRIASITDKMLTFARQQKPERTSVNINEIIRSTLAMRVYEMESSNIKVTTKLDSDIPITLADAGQLQQVFLNIILNAEIEMELAHGKGNLSIKTERVYNTLRVSFEDDGPGISKKNLGRLFDPFFSTRDPDKGTGLGLSVCHSIVTQHGGKIYARSTLRKGATFIVELPIVTKAEQLKMVEPTAEVSRTLSRARILVVDDDTIVQEFLTEVLREEGHEVEIIDNGNDVLERIDSEEYDVILLDIKLPGISGIDLYGYMQKTVKPLARRVIFITGDVMSADTMVFVKSAQIPYITKPFDAEQLKKNVDYILTEGA